MKKLWTVAYKDILVNFRDPAGLLLMLIAPLALTLVISAAFGGSSSGSPTITAIPVAVVSLDRGQFGDVIWQAFTSQDLADLMAPVQVDSAEAARAMVDDDKVAAAVIVPDGFSESILPSDITENGNSPLPESSKTTVEVYANPTRSISVGVVRSVVDTILDRILAGRISGQVGVTQLILSGRLAPQDAAALGESIGRQAGEESTQTGPVSMQTQVYTPQATAEDNFSWLKYSTASMAIFFLMYSLTRSTRSILAEKENGTLPRMLVAPTSRAEILGGKMLGSFLSGCIQMAILILAGTLLFHISWGPPAAVILVTLSLVLAVTGWGLLAAAFARTPGQASAIGSAITLVFAALAGNFVPRFALPDWLQKISLITPNAWGIDNYYGLMNGKGLPDVLTGILVMTLMGVVLFGASILAFRRQIG